VGLAPADGFGWALAALFVAGAMNPLINGPFFAILQATVAPEMQGRVFTLVLSLGSAMMPFSLAVAGPLADVVGVQPWYLVGGAIFALVGAASFFVRPLVNIERNGHPATGTATPVAGAGLERVPAAGE
ncbi:MAG TPA: hypothetical protein VLC52_06040, partial [Anaerolineae bacterium]|nr:hypothetical protein [Anaerolineae bacterium]